MSEPTIDFQSLPDEYQQVIRLAQSMLTNSESISRQDLCELAFNDYRNAGKGWANAILTLPMKRISDFYFAKSPKERNSPVLFEKNRLDETVPAVLDEIPIPKYARK